MQSRELGYDHVDLIGQLEICSMRSRGQVRDRVGWASLCIAIAWHCLRSRRGNWRGSWPRVCSMRSREEGCDRVELEPCASRSRGIVCDRVGLFSGR